jgi:outer membrane lipoprotein-sorting protein
MRYIGVLVLSIALMLLASCGPQPSLPSTGDTGGAAGETGDALDDLKDITSSQGSYKVEYEFSTNAAGQTITGTQTWVMKLPKMKIVNEMPQAKSSIYYMDDKVYICSDVQGQASCMMFDATEAEQQAGEAFSLNKDIESSPDDYNVQALPSRTIAGTTAQCFSVSAKAAGADWTAESCYSSKGVPLYIKSSGTTGGYSFES